MKRNSYFTIGMGFILLISLATIAQNKQSAVDPEMRKNQDSVNLLRLINTAEWHYKSKIGHFGNYVEVLKSGDMESAAKMSPGLLAPVFAKIDPNSAVEPIPGIDLSLALAATGNHFQVAIVDKFDRCGPAFFSDDQFLIYQGKAIDCDLTHSHTSSKPAIKN